MHDVSVDLSEEMLTKEIRRLAWMHGLFTYAKVRYQLRRSDKWKAKNKPAMTSLYGEVLDAAKHVRKAQPSGDMGSDGSGHEQAPSGQEQPST